MEEIGSSGKIIHHDVGLTLSTNSYLSSYWHTITILNQSVLAEFPKCGSFALHGEYTSSFEFVDLYDVATMSLNNEDVLWFMQYLARIHDSGLRLTLACPGLEPLMIYNITVQITPGGVHVEKVLYIPWYRHGVTLRLLDNKKLYKDIECVIQAANGYVQVLHNGHLGVGPLTNISTSVFIMRHYLGFISDVESEYRAYKDGSGIHVHMIFLEGGPKINTSKSAKAVSRGTRNSVFISPSSSEINAIVLNEEDPRLFYVTKLPGSNLSVFMSTSKVSHYLAVRKEDWVLHLERVANFTEFSHGHDNAKFKVVELGNQSFPSAQSNEQHDYTQIMQQENDDPVTHSGFSPSLFCSVSVIYFYLWQLLVILSVNNIKFFW